MCLSFFFFGFFFGLLAKTLVLVLNALLVLPVFGVADILLSPLPEFFAKALVLSFNAVRVFLVFGLADILLSLFPQLIVDRIKSFLNVHFCVSPFPP